MPIFTAAQNTREVQLFNNDWKFIKSDVKQGEAVTFNDSRWTTVNLPHDWSVKEPLNPSLASAAGYLPGGIGWYRKSFFIPAEKRGKEVSIYFEGISNNSEVFINGKSIGRRPNGYVSFSYNLSADLTYGDSNVIAVRVDRSRYNDARWYAGSGIVRNVYLQTTSKVHLQQWGTNYYTSRMDSKAAHVIVGSTVQNNAAQAASITLLQEIYEKGNDKLIAKSSVKAQVKAGSSQVINTRITVPAAKAWSDLSPNLYILKTTIVSNKVVVDEEITSVGFRTLAFDANKGFALNGKWMKLKGVCIHHDAGVLGAAVPKEVWERRLKTLKSIGVNAIRASHNPQNPDIYDLCDELGLLVMDEAFDEWKYPKKKWIEGWNVGTPGFDGYAPYFEEWGEKDLADMILRDRRHPSIIMWSIGNEVDYPNDPYSHPVLDSATIGQQVFGKYLRNNPDAMELGIIAKKLVEVVKANDTTRPSTAALAGVVMSNFTGYPDAVDVAGYNYTENRYDKDHATYPKRILYGSENRHDMPAWKAVRDKEYIFGQFLWTGIDYLGESGRWPARGSSAGLLNLGGWIKPRGYFRQSLWSDKPVMYVGTYINRRQQMPPSADAWPIWNYEEGEQVRVVSYTNAAKAQLFLNNQPVGDVKPYDDNTGIIYWDIPYKPGTLTVKGYNADNKEIAEQTIRTSGAPTAISLAAYKNEISKQRGVAQIEVQLFDDNGIPAVLADNMLNCRIEGPGKLLGLEAGDNTDTGNYTDNSQRVFRGRLIAYVEATGEGDINISFSSPWLKTATINIKAK
ncbi:MAG: DUF4982 domain-containing protein [Chitinophagaceae bacterium]|nr:DUF4982 domain-containing protein [Chitinophagaceae bacterium]